MRHNKSSPIFFISLVSLLIFLAPPATASQGSLEYCQKISDKIRYYSSLRKMGESAKKMENWKQQRKKHKERFTNRNCEKLKDKLKN